MGEKNVTGIEKGTGKLSEVIGLVNTERDTQMQ